MCIICCEKSYAHKLFIEKIMHPIYVHKLDIFKLKNCGEQIFS
jgi:hypothetical protein